jgi:hypothetical protein
LALAAEQTRIVITHNVRHFAPLARRWVEARLSHAGLILVVFPHGAYGPLLRRIERAFAARPRQDDWTDRAEFLGRR